MEKINPDLNIDRLIEDYKNLVFSICLKMTGDYFASEDLTQETFLSVYSKLSSFDGENAKAWVARIASNKCIDFLRSKAQKTASLTEPLSDMDIPDLSDLPFTSVSTALVLEKLKRECEALDETYRAVAIEHFINEKSAKEISLQLGLNLKTVQTRIYRAKEILKKSFEKELLLK